MSHTLRIYIWEGNGISDAYHDDGTLVVLAESPEQARQVMRDNRRQRNAEREAWNKERAEFIASYSGPPAAWTQTKKGSEIWSRYPGFDRECWDGSDSALDREPDRVVEIDGPKWVAFNGGGYD